MDDSGTEFSEPVQSPGSDSVHSGDSGYVPSETPGSETQECQTDTQDLLDPPPKSVIVVTKCEGKLTKSEKVVLRSLLDTSSNTNLRTVTNGKIEKLKVIKRYVN